MTPTPRDPGGPSPCCRTSSSRKSWLGSPPRQNDSSRGAATAAGVTPHTMRRTYILIGQARREAGTDKGEEDVTIIQPQVLVVA